MLSYLTEKLESLNIPFVFIPSEVSVEVRDEGLEKFGELDLSTLKEKWPKI